MVVLGETGRNFAAGMSGGVAYVLDQVGDFGKYHCNPEMVELSSVSDKDEADDLYALIQKHAVATGSQRAWNLLSDWEMMLPRFVKVLPIDYQKMLAAIEEQKSAGLSGDEALLAAFEANK